MQGTWVPSLVLKDLTCRRAIKPLHHSYWASTLEAGSQNYWAHELQPPKAVHPEAWALKQTAPVFAATRESPYTATKT